MLDCFSAIVPELVLALIRNETLSLAQKQNNEATQVHEAGDGDAG